ncbi:HNH endonuclease [Zhongshania guokunii]|uniref:HNH endonuclease n=1 Tax=Zhongshania guokunii TaxID=641783 RepID=A0ABV3UA40_9GAMM
MTRNEGIRLFRMLRMPASSISKFRAIAFSAQSGKCFYCKSPMWLGDGLLEFSALNGVSIKQARLLRCTAEHVVAKQDGGKNERANIVAACSYCNHTRHRSKRPLSADQYAKKISQKCQKKRWLTCKFLNASHN